MQEAGARALGGSEPSYTMLSAGDSSHDALRCMAANLANDPYPEVLMHRLKAQVMEKNAAQRELDRATAMVQQLKNQRRILKESRAE